MSKSAEVNIIVVGGGPAGLMAAGQAASLSPGRAARVLLLEKMDQPGRKLSLTGMGRCNLTNSANLPDFLAHFGSQGVFLRQAFARFFRDELVNFLERIGVATVVERGGRVFPARDDAPAVADKLIGWARACGMEIRCNSAVQRLLTESGCICAVQTRDGQNIPAHAVILATGGASYTGTGSTGDGYRMAAELGHTIQPLRPALVPIKTLGRIAPQLQGLALRNVRVNVFIDGRKSASQFGELLFTHFGLSGPVILTLSERIATAWDAGKKVEISIDLKPALDASKLDARLLRELDRGGRAPLKRILKNLLPRALVPVCAQQSGLAPDKPCHQVSAEERARLLQWLNDFRLEVSGHLPLEAAMVTAGGVALAEVDARTMQSRLVRGLYFAGEVLDLAADTGGFNLQAAFSTGWLAGTAARKGLDKEA